MELTTDSYGALTYDKVRGTGLANKCLNIEGNKTAGDSIQVQTGQRITEMCMEPLNYQVEEGGNGTGNYIPSVVTTKDTYSLAGIDGPLKVEKGKLLWNEKDGIDFAPTTV